MPNANTPNPLKAQQAHLPDAACPRLLSATLSVRLLSASTRSPSPATKPSAVRPRDASAAREPKVRFGSAGTGGDSSWVLGSASHDAASPQVRRRPLRQRGSRRKLLKPVGNLALTLDLALDFA